MDRHASSNHPSNGYPANHVEPSTAKKKTKKWSLGGLFKRRRTKSSDTDSCSECDEKKKGFLALRPSSNRHKTGSHKVVGKFETFIMPKKKVAEEEAVVEAAERTLNGIQRYDASPHVIKRKHNNIDNYRHPQPPLPNGHPVVSNDIEVTYYQNPIDFIRGSSGSLDFPSRHRGEKHKVKAKARAKAMRDRLADSSTSDDELYSSSRTSNGSSQRVNEGGSGSLNRRSRAARTDRYIKRHVKDYSPARCYSNPDSPLAGQAASSPRSKWVAKVVYQQSSDYPTRYTARTHSATSSPLSSPSSRPRSFQSSSLPGKYSTAFLNHSPQSWEALPKAAPPPPPRNPNRKVMPVDKYPPGRPSSYAFDATTKPSDIVAYVNHSSSSSSSRQNRLHHKSSSDMELLRQSQVGDGSQPKYCADRSPRSRNPIQLIEGDTCGGGDTPTVTSSQMLIPREVSLRKANEIGVPLPQQQPPPPPPVSLPHTAPPRVYPAVVATSRRPLSVVSEKSDNELLADLSESQRKPKRNPKDLEEALVELEEIYNSLRLSDEDLLDRAERRDLQAAIRMNPNFSRHSWNDLSEDAVDGAEVGLYESPDERRLFSPRLTSRRRSAVPDTVADDMAFRKLNKRRDPDPKTNSTLVSQSGSFLLVSPALSPPLLVDIDPVLGQMANEPHITLDDVVFRNMRQTNQALRLLDPQPPFGIPLGPVSPAPNSDYLHAKPAGKYRSTFNPSRTPDVVKDDLAFRNLRKDTPSGGLPRQFTLATAAMDAKKRRAIRSLSANVVSLTGSDEDAVMVDVNCNNLRKGSRSASVNSLPDVLEDLRSKRRMLIKNCDECLDQHPLPAQSKVVEVGAMRRVALHKPITLNQFNIAVGGEGAIVEKRGLHSSQTPALRLQPGHLDGGGELRVENLNLQMMCPPHYGLNGNAGGEFSEHMVDGADDGGSVAKSDNFENSSSGVSSTSDTPDSSSKSQSDAGRRRPMRYVTELYVDKGVTPSGKSDDDDDDDDDETLAETRRRARQQGEARSRKCSRIEITLSTPQPSGGR